MQCTEAYSTDAANQPRSPASEANSQEAKRIKTKQMNSELPELASSTIQQNS